MSKERFQRTKYLRIMEILQQESDADRPISTNDLIAKLGKFGISIDRRTLYEDIVVLNELGYEVFCKKGRANNYYVVDRKFDVPELRILMDAVESASFITDKKTKELLDKIASLGGSYRAELLQRNRKTFDIRKHTNESIYYSVSSIDDAILHSKQISFQYFDFGINGERVFRNEGRRYVVSPLSTAFVDNNYYLVAYYKKYNS
ncbi:MAG: WYL domain-containing protein, partial [Clostridia bacterium]